MENLSKYLVEYKTHKYYINKKLCDMQKLSEDNIRGIVQKHIQKLMMFEQMEETDDPNKLKELAQIVNDIEFDLQELWGFALDENFHEWYLVPKCTCPKLDNIDRRGTKYRIFSGDCPIHGV